MAYQIEWSPRAMEDVKAIAMHIGLDSPAHAVIVAKKMMAAIRQAGQLPYAGRIVPEFGDSELREKFVYSYRIIYRVQRESILIVAVMHGKRLLELELQP